MGRINLQLFALKLNTDTSIVDYLKSQGKDSSYSSRKELANQYGISDYTGTASQNTQLLQMLQNSSASNTTGNSKVGSDAAAAGVAAAAQLLKKKIDQNNSNTANKTPAASGTTSGTASDTVQAANNLLTGQKNSLTDGDIVNSGIMVGGVLGAGTNAVETDKATKPTFTPTQAPSYTEPQTTAPTFTPVETPTYNGVTTQGKQATTLEQRLPADTLATLNSKFQVSQAYQQAMEYTNSLLQQLSGGKTTYTDQISQLISDYQNRDKFSYDADSDPLFQQALASAMRSGKTAMQDTMGQAAALTGGYGSSYATNVGQNVYNQYVQEAYDMLPEYYQLALDAYEREGQNMLNQLTIMDNADSKEYERLYNAYSANYNNAQNLYQQEYGAWRDSVDNAYNYAGLLNSDYWNKMNYDENIRQYDQSFEYQKYLDEVEQNNWQNQFNYQQYMDQVAQNQWASEFEYQKYLDQLSQNNWQNEFDYQQYLDAINQSNYEKEFEYQKYRDELEQSNWQDEFDYMKEQDSLAQENYENEFGYQKEQDKQAQTNYENEFAYQQFQDKQSQTNYENEFAYQKEQDALSQSNWEKEYSQAVDEFNQSLTEDQRQFDESLAEEKRQFDESLSFDKEQVAQDQANYEREMAIKESQANSEAAKDAGEFEYKTPTQKMYKEAMEAYETGGEAALDKYLETAPDYEIEALYDYATGYGTIGLEARTYTKIKDTINGFWGVDNNDVVTDQYGNEYKISDLPKSIRKQLTALKKGESYDFSTGKKVTK